MATLPTATLASPDSSSTFRAAPHGITRRSFLYAATGLLLSAAWGCGRKRSSDTVESYSSVIVTPFDISSSTNMVTVRERYFRDFQTVISGLSGDAYVSGYPITADTEATSMADISQTFPTYNPLTDNKDEFDTKLAQAQAAALSQARTLLTGQKPAPATDLLNAFTDASKVFNGDIGRAAQDRRLVIFSDMIHQAGSDDFLEEDLTDQRIAQIIARQRAAGQIPPLTGVRVWAAGATADAEGRISPEKITQIRRFWTAFFEACGASLTPEHYSTHLINYL